MGRRPWAVPPSRRCTRGVTTTGGRELLEHKNRLYAYAIPYVWIVPEEQQALGTDLVIASTSRRIPPQSVDPTVELPLG